MSRHETDLRILLVENIYGGLTSRIYRILLRYGRLSVGAIQFYARLSPSQAKHGLSVLIQQDLVLWYTPSANEATSYEANASATYNLARVGRFIKIAEDRFGEFSGAIVSDLLRFGHIRVGDLVKAYGLGYTKEGEGRLAATYGHPEFPAKIVPNGVNGSNSAEKYSDESEVTLKKIHLTLYDLLRAGLVIRVHESQFRSDADKRTEAERAVKPIAEYKAKSKKDQEAQWESAVQAKLEERKYGNEEEEVELDDLRLGKKRPLEGPETIQAKKSRHLFLRQTISGTGETYQTKLYDGYTELLRNDLVLRINHAKFVLMMRSKRLVEFADRAIGASTAKVYEKALRGLEPKIRDCGDNPKSEDDEDEDFVSLAFSQITTDEIVAAIHESSDLASALGTVDSSQIKTTAYDHPKKRRKKEPSSEDEATDTSPDEDEKMSGIDDSISEVSQNYLTDAEGEDFPLSSNPHHRTIRLHLLLLAQHPLRFLHYIPRTATTAEKWTINFPPLIAKLSHQALIATIKDRYGGPSARIANVLASHGKLDEKSLCALSLIAQKEMRARVDALRKNGLLELQEVPRDNARVPTRTTFLSFFDTVKCKSKVLEETYKSMCRQLQRAKAEKEKVKSTLEKAGRSDVVGREEELLGVQEREALGRWRGVEERLLGEVLRLDDMVGLLRDF